MFNFKGAIVRGGLNWKLGDPGYMPSGAAGTMFGNGPPRGAYDWTGYYVGANGGGIWGSSDVVSNRAVPFPVFTNVAGNLIVPAQLGTWPAASGSGSSFVGGGQAGYNWQTGQIVWGAEADIDGASLHEASTTSLTRGPTIAGSQTVTANYSAQVDWIATLRGKVGYAWDRLMLYGTVGLAVADTTVNTTYGIMQPAPTPTPGAASSSAVIPGWTAGVGGEWAIASAWTAGIEYRHTDLGRHGYNLGFTDVALAPFVGPTSGTVHFTTDQVTARLSWHWR
jgi:outer membrane immunogenic protein